MPRILHILDHSLPAQSGYTFRTRALMKAQAARGWAVVGVTGVRHPQPLSGPGPDHDIADGLDFHRTAAISPAPSPLREWREIAALASQVEAVARDFRPDILHAHSPALNGLAALRAARRLNLPLLYEIRAFWEDAAVGNGTGRPNSLKYHATRALENHVVHCANAVAVICDGLRRDLVQRGVAPDKVMVSPNGVDLALFGTPPPRDAALAAELRLDGADVLGFIGSFYDYEGIDVAIAAMPALVAAHPRAKLLLVGGGPRADAWAALAAASPAADHIRFVGRVPHHAVERYYSLVDILVYPRKAMRLTELVTPLKPLEAMAQGRLVAASAVGGHRELIADGDTGVLFAPDDPAALAAAVSGLLSDRSGWDAMRRRARSYVEAERNWSSNILRYDAVYQRLLNGARPAMTMSEVQA